LIIYHLPTQTVFIELSLQHRAEKFYLRTIEDAVEMFYQTKQPQHLPEIHWRIFFQLTQSAFPSFDN
jgi:hypothetical protein